MSLPDSFDEQLTDNGRSQLAALTTPRRIQNFLDKLPYSEDHYYRCPLRVLRDAKAHCFDGALLAAALLRRLGYPPLILELLPNERDDDHLLALFKENGYWGALAQSNFVGLRYREPIHRSLRELVITYFEPYFNVAGERTLRGYTLPLNLAKLDYLEWMTGDDHLETVEGCLDRKRQIPLMTGQMLAGLSPVDERSRQAGLLGSKAEGLFKLE